MHAVNLQNKKQREQYCYLFINFMKRVTLKILSAVLAVGTPRDRFFWPLESVLCNGLNFRFKEFVIMKFIK
jgi:hypothetical protein